MGAIVASELARELQGSGGPLPQHLFVSARRPSHWPDVASPLHELIDADFVVEIERRYGGIPPQVRHDPEVMALLLPSLRADIEALERFHPPAREPLRCSVSAFGGSHDQITPRAHLDGWRTETSGEFRVKEFVGGHFFLDLRRDELLSDIAESLLGARRGSA
jgi:surfactin synthase thioesterase subunit